MLPDNLKIKDFTLIKILGTGSFSVVYLARYNDNGLLYALKKIHKTKYGETVKREVEIMQRLKHPFIVNVEGFFETKNHFFIVSEYIDGIELFYFLKNVKKENPYIFTKNNYQLTKLIISQIILALEFMHNNDFVHLDIKPENILINKFGYIKIVDLGFARRLNKNIKNEYHILYRNDKIEGTIEYLSPEMLRKYYGKCSDIWALGILLIELSHDKPIFYNMNKDVILKTIQKCEIKNIIPNNLSIVLRDLLENIFKYPKKRFTVINIKTHKFFKNHDWVNILMRKDKISNVELPLIYKSESDNDNDIKEEYLFNKLN